jgi:ferrous iron transport protein B
MSCSARMPVYLLFAGAFFGKHGGGVLFVLYVTGILFAALMARIFKKFLIKGEDIPFVMELPPYRMPTGKAIFRHMWDKSSQYLKKMGGIILIASIIIWYLEYFPQDKERNERFNSQIVKIEEIYKDFPEKKIEKDSLITHVKNAKRMEHQKNSYIGRMGIATEPLVKPLGFDWKMSVSLLSGMAAKEIVVSTLGILYIGDGENEIALEKSLLTEKKEDGNFVFTPLVVISFLLFVLIYFPCIATVVAIKNESGSWKWAAFVVVYTTALAWIVSFLVYQIGSLIIY